MRAYIASITKGAAVAASIADIKKETDTLADEYASGVDKLDPKLIESASSHMKNVDTDIKRVEALLVQYGPA